MSEDAAKKPEGEVIEDEVAKQKAKKKKIMIIAGAVIALLIIALGAFFLLSTKSDDAEKPPEAKYHQPKPHDASEVVEDVFYDLDNFVINLNSTGGRARFLKMTITLHIKSDVDVNIISKKIPIIRDNFQFYMRELRPSDLEGSKEMAVIKEELMLRINKILAPIVVQDLLFKEILVN